MSPRHRDGPRRSTSLIAAPLRDQPQVRLRHQARGNLPAAVSGFLGRDAELQELKRLRGRSRLLTLTGPPGIGKSRLALQLLGDTRAGESWLVELASVSDPEHVAGAVAGALTVAEVPGKTNTDALVARLRERRLTLVLDNCEHLVSATAQLADALLRCCPGLSIVTTSREPLQIMGETVWEVPPLSLPSVGEATEPEALIRFDATRLFVERARAVRPGFALDPGAVPTLIEICRRLDGIPLAIELAAARLGVLTLNEIATRLDARFSLLVKGGRGVLPRHQTLEAALDWSYDMLPEAEAMLLRRLSVFAGGFCLEAAEGACSDAGLEAGQVLDLLDRLISRSLVVADTTRHSQGARYRLLETIRAYGSERLEQAGEAARLGQAHASFYLALVERAEPQLTGPGQQGWFERLEAERANLRCALDWSLAHDRGEWALRLAGALVLFWRVRCHFSEGRGALARVLAATDGDHGRLRAGALWGAGFMALMAGDLDGAVSDIEASLARARELGDLRGQARALLILGNAHQARSHESAVALLAESATLAREAGDAWCLAHALSVAGFGYSSRDEMESARPLFEESLAVAREAQDKQGLRFGLIGLGQVAVCQGDYRSAEPVLLEAVTVADELGEDYSKAWGLQCLGQMAIGQGEYGRARDLLEQALALVREVGNPAALVPPLVSRAQVARAEGDGPGARRLCEEALALCRSGAGSAVRPLQGLGELATQDDDLGAAACLLEEALDLARALGDRRGAAQALHGCADLARAEGDPKRAATLENEALELRRGIGDTPGITASLEAVGGLAAEGGRFLDAARLFGAAAGLRDANGYARPPWRRSRYEADLARVRQSLSKELFEDGFAQGLGLSVDEAVTQAGKGRGRRRKSATGWSSLTDVERQVADLVAEGLTNPEIAERLFISLGTVKDHLTRLFSKLGVGDRRELAREFRRRSREPVAAQR